MKIEDGRQFKKRYVSVSVIFFLLALLLFLLPKKYDMKQKQASQILSELLDETRFVSTDEVAKKIINKEPGVRLIDVRSEDEFKKFSLPGAINIPLEKILQKEKDSTYTYAGILNNDKSTLNIFYSNGSIYSNQAWLILRRMNYKNNYVMKGGLNKWFETIINPSEPKQTDSDSEHRLYDSRKAYSMYFGGGTSVSSGSDNTAKSAVPIIKKKKKSGAGGGC